MTAESPFTQNGILHATINKHRFHLRLKDPTPDNFLWIDGRILLLLDAVAGDFVSNLLQGMWQFQQGQGDDSEKVRQFVVEQMYRKYGRRLAWPAKRITRERLGGDLDRIFGTIMGIAEGACPVDTDLAMKEIDINHWIAPARMDLALTYRCNLNCAHCYASAAARSEIKELTTAQWKKVLERLWEIGVPNVVFTGGEPTLREDLVELVEAAKPFVTGLVTNGTQLAKLARALQTASLDYVQVTLESHLPEVHNAMVSASFDAFSQTVEGITAGLEAGLQAITNTTLTRQNASQFPQLIKFCQTLGLQNMACNTLICSGGGIAAKKENGLSPAELKTVLEQAIRTAQEQHINLQWYSPTCYLHLNPVELGFGVKGCSAAAYNMTIQPDGSILPCQSWPEPVGNLLQDPWPMIWNHPICVKLRNHGFAQENPHCKTCLHHEVCGGACPLEGRESRG